MPDVSVMAWIAGAAGIAAMAGALVTTIGAWRSWRRARHVGDVALALLDVHQERLDVAVAAVGERMVQVADHGDVLVGTLTELRADAQHLRWMLSRFPEERARLERELLDLVLPTRGAQDA